MKANPLTEATVKISIADNGLIFRKSLSMLSLLAKIDTMMTTIEVIRAAVATGVALKT